MTDPMELAGRLEAYRPTNEWGDPVHHVITDEAAACIREMVEWRPIETAPRDGTWVVLKDEYSPATIGQWAHNDDATYPWRVFDGSDECNAWVAGRPCYWLPLPPAPGAEA